MPLRDLALMVGVSWAFWAPAPLSGLEEPAPLVPALHYAGGLMPLAVTLALLFARRDRDYRRDYWRRLVDFRRIEWKSYALILLITPALTAGGAALDALLGGGGLELEEAARLLRQPFAVAPFLVFTLLFGPLPEELAWRGYALDQLQARRSPLAASLIVGLVWTVWHLPLFFIQSSYQHGLGLGAARFWLFLLDFVPVSVVMTWIFNQNRRSTLSAVLLHFTINAVGELFALTLRAEAFTIAWWWAAAIIVVWAAGMGQQARCRDQAGAREGGG